MVDFDLKNKKSEPIELEDKKPILDKLGRAYATGRRKTSVSRVWLKYGAPKIVVNGKPLDKYFLRKILEHTFKILLKLFFRQTHHGGGHVHRPVPERRAARRGGHGFYSRCRGGAGRGRGEVHGRVVKWF